MEYAPNNTSRFKVYYRVAGRTHSHTLRRAFTTANVDSVWANVLPNYSGIWASIEAVLYQDFRLDRAEYALKGSDVFFPLALTDAVTITPSGPGWTGTNEQLQAADTHFTFAGKAADAVRTNLKFYGLDTTSVTNADVGWDGVSASVEYAAVGTIVTGLGGLLLLSISGVAVQVWYPRATVKRNDYWLRRTRQAS